MHKIASILIVTAAATLSAQTPDSATLASLRWR
jgi:hypothetical protein